ncbi:MAG: hypothetical protein HXX16_18215 [Bacteroidales bacterium]|nr:hypothetical protein [Bacteroidales bacterium]
MKNINENIPKEKVQDSLGKSGVRNPDGIDPTIPIEKQCTRNPDENVGGNPVEKPKPIVSK